MPYRAVIILVLTLTLAGQAGIAGAVHSKFGETREYVRDWLAACRNDGSGYCSVVAYVRDPQGPGGIAAQFRVARPRPGAALEMVFTPVTRLADVTRPMTLRVDANPEVALPPGTGFARAGGLNDYGIVDDAVVAALIPQLKKGASMTLDYVDEAGETARFAFSLMGFTGALRFIDDTQFRAEGAVPASDPEAPRHVTAGPVAFSCRGNEPFWTLAIDGPDAEYSRLTDAARPRTHPLKGTMNARDYFKPPLFVWRGRGERASGDMVAMITGERCLDTMSDGEGQTTSDYTVRVSMPNAELLTGCCTVAARPAPAALPEGLEDAPEANFDRKAPDDWSRLVLELLPAIRACLAETPGPVARVAKAWPMNRGMVGARTRDDGGRHWNCVAPADGSEVNIFAPVPDGARISPGETRVVFTPVPQSPPTGKCYRHERVTDPETGSLIGWLSYDTC